MLHHVCGHHEEVGIHQVLPPEKQGGRQQLRRVAVLGPLYPHPLLPAQIPAPYDTEEKRQIVLNYLSKERDGGTLSWKMVVYPENLDESLSIAKEKVTAPKPAEVAKPKGFMGWYGDPTNEVLKM